MTDQHEIDRWHDDGGPALPEDDGLVTQWWPDVRNETFVVRVSTEDDLVDWDDLEGIDVDDDYALVDAEATVLVDGGEWINSLFYSDYQDAGDDDDRVTVDIPPSVTGLWSQLSAPDRFDIFADDDNGRDF